MRIRSFKIEKIICYNKPQTNTYDELYRKILSNIKMHRIGIFFNGYSVNAAHNGAGVHEN